MCPRSALSDFTNIVTRIFAVLKKLTCIAFCVVKIHEIFVICLFFSRGQMKCCWLFWELIFYHLRILSYLYTLVFRSKNVEQRQSCFLMKILTKSNWLKKKRRIWKWLASMTSKCYQVCFIAGWKSFQPLLIHPITHSSNGAFFTNSRK